MLVKGATGAKQVQQAATWTNNANNEWEISDKFQISHKCTVTVNKMTICSSDHTDYSAYFMLIIDLLYLVVDPE